MRKIKELKDLTANEYFIILKYIDQMNSKECTPTEGISAIMSALVPGKNISKLSAKVVEELVGSAVQVINNTTVPEYNPTIKIQGVLYGIQASFESMEAGAFFDLQTFVGAGSYIEALAVLYRPVTQTYLERMYTTSSYVDEPNEAFEYRASILGDELTAADAKGAINFFANSLLT